MSLNLCQYDIIEKIGSGCSSTVYLVKERDTGIKYAAKVYRIIINEYTKDSNENIKLIQDSNQILKLSHPSLIKTIGISQYNFNNECQPTLIMEYSNMGTLQSMIDLENSCRAPSNWTFTKKLINIYGISSGMSYLCDQHIIHYNLNPANILLDENLYPKIANYGISQISSLRIISDNLFQGTPLYMAPEVLNEEIRSELSCVYSFAIVVYQILLSKSPFSSFKGPVLKIMQEIAIKGSRPEIDSSVPEAYRNLIERCWSQDPKKRPTFCQIVNELESNTEFITENMDENEFYKYIDFIHEI